MQQIYRRAPVPKCKVSLRLLIIFSFLKNALKYLTVSLSTQILVLSIDPFLFILVSIFCEFARRRAALLFILLSVGTDVHILQHIHQSRLNPFSVIIFVCLGNIFKLLHRSCWYILLMKLLMNWAQFINNFIKSLHWED